MSTDATVSSAHCLFVEFQPAGGDRIGDTDGLAERIRDTLEGASVQLIAEVGESGHKRLLILTGSQDICDSQEVHFIPIWGSESEIKDGVDLLLQDKELHYVNKVGIPLSHYEYLILVTRPKAE